MLVIMAAVADGLAEELIVAAREWGMDALVEVHDAAELERALRLNVAVDLIGINNRDLKRMVVDLGTSIALAPPPPSSAGWKQNTTDPRAALAALLGEAQ